MTKNSIENIIQFIKSGGGIVKTKDFIKAGFHNKYLHILESEGSIVKIKRGLYILSGNESASGFFEIQKAVPGSIICLGSALSYYGLTTYESPFIWIAVQRGIKIVLPEYPPSKLYRFSKAQYSTGIQMIKHEGNKIRIYDKEKTICDTIRYRNKIGLDITNEAVKNYIKSKDKHIRKVIEYARILRLAIPVSQYLKVLL